MFRKKMKTRNTAGDKVFYIVIYILLTAFFITVLYPCVFIVSASFSSGTAVQAGKVILWPVNPTTEGYRIIFRTSTVWTGFRNSIIYTVASVVLAVALTMTTAYCLSRNDVPGRNLIMFLFTFTMFFNGGLIPTYMLIRNLGMLNTPWAVIVPGCLGVWNLIITRTFLQNNVPAEMMEAAKIDGCSDIGYYIKIVLPLSKAIIAVLVLFYGVGQWNSYFNPMIYLSNRNLFPLTIFLREILTAAQIEPEAVDDPEYLMRLAEAANIIKYALIIVTIVPVIILYPFVQKYFVKGIMVGSIKG